MRILRPLLFYALLHFLFIYIVQCSEQCSVRDGDHIARKVHLPHKSHLVRASGVSIGEVITVKKLDGIENCGVECDSEFRCIIMEVDTINDNCILGSTFYLDNDFLTADLFEKIVFVKYEQKIAVKFADGADEACLPQEEFDERGDIKDWLTTHASVRPSTSVQPATAPSTHTVAVSDNNTRIDGGTTQQSELDLTSSSSAYESPAMSSTSATDGRQLTVDKSGTTEPSTKNPGSSSGVVSTTTISSDTHTIEVPVKDNITANLNVTKGLEDAATTKTTASSGGSNGTVTMTTATGAPTTPTTTGHIEAATANTSTTTTTTTAASPTTTSMQNNHTQGATVNSSTLPPTTTAANGTSTTTVNARGASNVTREDTNCTLIIGALVFGMAENDQIGKEDIIQWIDNRKKEDFNYSLSQADIGIAATVYSTIKNWFNGYYMNDADLKDNGSGFDGLNVTISFGQNMAGCNFWMTYANGSTITFGMKESEFENVTFSVADLGNIACKCGIETMISPTVGGGSTISEEEKNEKLSSTEPTRQTGTPIDRTSLLATSDDVTKALTTEEAGTTGLGETSTSLDKSTPNDPETSTTPSSTQTSATSDAPTTTPKPRLAGDVLVNGKNYYLSAGQRLSQLRPEKLEYFASCGMKFTAASVYSGCTLRITMISLAREDVPVIYDNRNGKETKNIYVDMQQFVGFREIAAFCTSP